MYRSVICLAALALASSLAGVATAESGSNPQLYAPGADVHGHSRVYWASEVAKWEQEIPVPDNPIANPESPLNCSTDVSPIAYVGQPTSVTGQGACRIPAGTPFSIVPVSWGCSTAEGKVGNLGSFHGRTWKNLRRCAHTMFRRDYLGDEVTLRMWIDGSRIENIFRYTVTTRPRMADFPEDNVWEELDPSDVEIPAGPTKTITRVMFLLFKPLSPGLHRIRIHANIPAWDDEPFRDVWRIRVVR